MGTFVLVHGAWHGGWCYGRTAKILRAQGHDVFTPRPAPFSRLRSRASGSREWS